MTVTLMMSPRLMPLNLAAVCWCLLLAPPHSLGSTQLRDVSSKTVFIVSGAEPLVEFCQMERRYGYETQHFIIHLCVVCYVVPIASVYQPLFIDTFCPLVPNFLADD